MYGYDKRLSMILAAKYSQLIEEQACYNNVYHLVSDFLEDLRPRDKLRVLFCYRQGPDHRYYRHVFAVFDGKLVEPLPYLDMSEENRNTIIPIREMTCGEYIELLCEERETQLRDVLYEQELQIVKDHGLYRSMNPFDLAMLIRNIDDTWLPDTNEKHED